MFGTQKTTSIKKALSIFGFLIREHGFALLEKNKQEAFGNFILIYKGSFFVRVVNDRDDIFIDVKPLNNEEKWFDLRNVLELLELDKAMNYTNASTEQLASLLDKNVAKLEMLLNNNYEELVEKLKVF